MKKNKPNPKANRSILFITYLMVGLFVCMIGYFGYFLQWKRNEVINNSYNARLDQFANRIVRGEIQSKDGRVLAQTQVTEDGIETRTYPYDSLFAHVIGYADRGKTGLESLANFYLLSSNVNIVERTMNELSGVKNKGDHVVTTLDVDLQQVASDALGDRNGAVVVMEPDTGKILAMVSKPGFNPNTLAADWDGLISQENTKAQLLNRATQGVYPPGSTFKIITVLQYFREHPQDWQSYHFDCDGLYEYEDYTISCYNGSVHGSQNLEQVFANSCNGAFASMGLDLNLSLMRSLADGLLFNKELPLSIPYSKSSYSMGENGTPWEILQTSIGQGNTQMTPMHNSMLTAAIANGGVLMTPYLIDRVEEVRGGEVKKFLPVAYGNLMSAEESARLASLMEGVVTTGTGSAVRTDAYTVAGKTGSAEYETGKETHAWFTGYAPVEAPEIVITVMVEASGSGGKVAAPVARAIFDQYFLK